MKIAIAGATGAVGRLVVAAATRAGHESVLLSRSNGVDLLSPAGPDTDPADGLAARLDGVDAVVDVSSTATLATDPAVRFFEGVTSNLLAAESLAGVPHHVALSIVGAAAADSGYYAGKAAQERMLEASGTGWTVLRATQFHEFAVQTASRPPILGLQVVPIMRSQPVAAAEVADELLRIAEDSPAGLVADLAGPREESMPATSGPSGGRRGSSPYRCRARWAE